MSQPDFSSFVVHFTKRAAPYSAAFHPEDAEGIADLDVRQRLAQILSNRKIRATHIPWTNQKAVCFTECTWPSLLRHCARYSKFGIGMRKSALFARGGAPAFYMRHDHYQSQCDAGGFDGTLYSFITPFVPDDAPTSYLEGWDRGKVDYSYEREWRVAADVSFGLEEVAFLLVATHTDIAEMPDDVRHMVPADNWVIVSNYEKIEQRRPQHNLGRRRLTNRCSRPGHAKSHSYSCYHLEACPGG